MTRDPNFLFGCLCLLEDGTDLVLYFEVRFVETSVDFSIGRWVVAAGDIQIRQPISELFSTPKADQDDGGVPSYESLRTTGAEKLASCEAPLCGLVLNYVSAAVGKLTRERAVECPLPRESAIIKKFVFIEHFSIDLLLSIDVFLLFMARQLRLFEGPLGVVKNVWEN